MLGYVNIMGNPEEKGELADVQEIDENTICQCTGLRDRKGELIFESDIVRHYNDSTYPEAYDVGLVLFGNSHPRFERTSKNFDDNVGIGIACIYEVIGNKFDNPELLEVEK